jgi:hypothetical protein
VAEQKSRCADADPSPPRAHLPAGASPGHRGLPEKLPSGVTVESLHLDGIGRVYLSNFGGIVCMTPAEGLALARTVFLKAQEAAREEVLDAA